MDPARRFDSRPWDSDQFFTEEYSSIKDWGWCSGLEACSCSQAGGRFQVMAAQPFPSSRIPAPWPIPESTLAPGIRAFGLCTLRFEGHWQPTTHFRACANRRSLPFYCTIQHASLPSTLVT